MFFAITLANHRAYCFKVSLPTTVCFSGVAYMILYQTDQIIIFLTIFNQIAIQGTPQMAADNEAISLSRIHSSY